MRLRGTKLAAVGAIALLVTCGLVAAVPLGADGSSIRSDDPHLSCDPFGQRACLLPFPNDVFTVPDRAMPTGRRVDIPPSSMPVNTAGVRVDPTQWNRNDGFSPGTSILVFADGIDLARSGVATSNDIAASLRSDAPIVLLDTETGRRWPYFAELDAHAQTDQDRSLIIHPATNLAEGHRYVVALRHVVRADGTPLFPSAAFVGYRDGATHDERTRAMNRIFDALGNAGVTRHDLYLAWDFTVSSTQSLTERLLSMRDQTMRSLRGKAPAFHVDRVIDHPAPSVLRDVSGTFTVPEYLTGDGGVGSVLNNGSDPHHTIPIADGSTQADFACVVPANALNPDGRADPTRIALYGHGLFQDASSVAATGVYAASSHTTLCATDWVGMASGDAVYDISIGSDISKFPSLPDRMQQAMLNMMVLGRLMTQPTGLASAPVFQDADGHPLLSGGPLTYLGVSLGGIAGAAVTSVAQDWRRAVLEVPGEDFAVLQQRSIVFAIFQQGIDAAYPDPVMQQLGIAMVQMLWDRGEATGYVSHLTSDPLPGTPKHTVLLLEGFGDNTVANVGTEMLARTIGAHVREPALAPGRSHDTPPLWGIPPIKHLPYKGTALEVWDFGTPAPPPDNQPNRGAPDPHALVPTDPALYPMISRFLAPVHPALVNICGAGPCGA